MSKVARPPKGGKVGAGKASRKVVRPKAAAISGTGRKGKTLSDDEEESRLLAETLLGVDTARVNCCAEPFVESIRQCVDGIQLGQHARELLTAEERMAYLVCLSDADYHLSIAHEIVMEAKSRLRRNGEELLAMAEQTKAEQTKGGGAS